MVQFVVLETVASSGLGLRGLPARCADLSCSARAKRLRRIKARQTAPTMTSTGTVIQHHFTPFASQKLRPAQGSQVRVLPSPGGIQYGGTVRLSQLKQNAPVYPAAQSGRVGDEECWLKIFTGSGTEPPLQLVALQLLAHRFAAMSFAKYPCPSRDTSLGVTAVSISQRYAACARLVTNTSSPGSSQDLWTVRLGNVP